MRGDGDGWTFGADGVKHWGRFGAAGLLLRAPNDDLESMVLLQHRAIWSHQGGTWALPGGARDSHETAVHAAVREAHEEAGIEADFLRVRAETVTATAPSGWTYTTVVADASTPLTTVPNGESLELRWVPERDVASLPLHPAFAQSWPTLRADPVTVVIDTANVLGATNDLLVGGLPRTLELAPGRFGWVSRIVAAVEDDAREVFSADPLVTVLRSPRR